MAQNTNISGYATSKLNLPQPIGRMNPYPNDSTEVWDTYANAQSYAQSGATAYVGQIIYVQATGKHYKISDAEGTLAEIGGTADTSGKEDVSNKVSTVDENSTDLQYPSAKCLYDGMVGALQQVASGLLPPVTPDDNGKILAVQDGAWSVIQIDTWTGGSY